MSRRPRLKPVIRTPSSKQALAGFEPAENAQDAEWVEEALRGGDFGKVSGVAPLDFEACVAILHPAQRCICTADNLKDFQAGLEQPVPVRWSDVAVATVPVIYGRASQRVLGMSMSRRTQCRRLRDGGWLVEPVGGDGDLTPLIRIGDIWMGGPDEGSLPPDLARPLVGLLEGATATPDSCWFGLWEGFGFLSEAARAGASIAAQHRRWLLYRGAVEQLTNSFDSWPQSANLVWPEDRSWCLATEIDAECTLIGGSRKLISAIYAEPSLEVQAVCPEDRLPRLGDVLVPVVDRPPHLTLPPAFEAREYQHPFNRAHGLKVLKRGPRVRALRLWLRVIRSIHIKRKGKD